MIAGVAGLSLKWRLLIPLTLALAVGVLSLTWINDANLRRQAEQTRLTNLKTNADLLGFLVQQNIRQLVEIGGSLADTLTVGGHLPALDTQAVNSAELERLGQGQSIVSLSLYDPQHNLVGSHGRASIPLRALSKRLGKVLADDQPVGGLYCAQPCHFYAVVPVLRNGITVAALVLTSDLSALIDGFARGIRRDVALLGDLRSGRILAMTAPELPAALPGLSFNVATSAGAESAFSHDQERTFEWQRFRLQNAEGSQAALLTRRDTSAASAARNRALLVNLGTGLIVFLLAEAALLMALRWLMRRMGRVSAGLPLLGEGRWLEARTLLRGAASQPSDEFGLLERAALALTGQLEQLDLDSRRQQNDLAKLVDALSSERDFTGRVLDTAQALIVTQTTDGIVRMANRHAELLCGRGRGELIGSNFFETLVAPSDSEPFRLRLAGHFGQPNSPPLHVEAPLDGASGRRNIAWVHSPVYESDSTTLILSVGIDLTELKNAQAQADYLTEYDPLTGLYNRQAFQTRLERLLAEGPGALVFMDLDNFKAINDLVGHEAGDTMIRQTADRLRALTPPPRLIGRLGGDDFALFFDAMPDAALLQIARQISPGDRSRDMASACVGLALAEPEFRSAERLMAQADLALSKARAKGRASWHLFSHDDGTRETLVRNNEHLDQISDALRDDRLKLYLQPVIALQTGRVSHYEALLRVHLPDGQCLAPAPLIAAAEASGLIRDVDRWVMRQAINLISRSDLKLKLAINLSARSLDAALAPELEALLATHGVPPQNLSLEVTETTALEQLDHASEQLTAIRALGCKLALDDFGVGFSTFQYLKHLPVDYVKIDGSFIRTLDRNDDDRVFVRALVEAIHGYGKLAVAEYVETDAILRWVQTLEVDFAQGYYFGRPRSAEEILAAPLAL